MMATVREPNAVDFVDRYLDYGLARHAVFIGGLLVGLAVVLAGISDWRLFAAMSAGWLALTPIGIAWVRWRDLRRRSRP